MAIFERENASVLINYRHLTENACALSYQLKYRFCKSMQPCSNQPQPKQS